MHNFKAIGYHGTDKVISEKKHINFNHNEFKDHFLGRGFYLFRDSPKRALHWTTNKHDGIMNNVIEVEIEIPENEVLNFSSSIWSHEIKILATNKVETIAINGGDEY